MPEVGGSVTIIPATPDPIMAIIQNVVCIVQDAGLIFLVLFLLVALAIVRIRY